MSLGSQLHESLRMYGDTLPDGPVRDAVNQDVTRLRRDGVDGVAVQDDTAAAILGRLYSATEGDYPPVGAQDRLTVTTPGGASDG